MSDNVEWLRERAQAAVGTHYKEVLTACADELAKLRRNVESFRASLRLVAQLDGQTLLGPSDLDFDHLTKRVPDQCWAHEVGAARAFNQAAEIAKEALKEHGTL